MTEYIRGIEMPVREEGESLIHYGRRRAEALGLKISTLEPALEPPQPAWDPRLIPDIGEPVKRPEDIEMDVYLDKIDILDAYTRWCGKMVPKVGNKRESIMVSCPYPGHADNDPSAWVNLDEGDGGVGNCPIDGGFDKYILAGWHFNLDPKTQFPELRQKMAEEAGYRVVVRGKVEWLVPDQPPSDGQADATASAASSSAEGVAALSSADEIDDEPEYPSFNWRELGTIKAGTFLYEWMRLSSESYEPEEYYFWLGLQAVAAAAGNNVVYEDRVPVRPNLLACLTGTTGTGKSIAIGFFEELLREALPFEPDTGKGVRMIASPGSAEALVDEFIHEVERVDPTTGQPVMVQLPINGLYRESELSTFMRRAQRSGNTVRETVMDMYDSSRSVTARSRVHGRVEAMDHFAQMTTSTQPASLGRLLTDADAASGFLNRWVFAYGAPKSRPSRGAKRIDVTPAIAPLQQISKWAEKPRSIEWHDAAAAELWDRFFELEIRPISEAKTDESWLTARMELLAKKMLCAFAINDRSTTILIEHVETLMLLWAYIRRSYGLIEGSMGRTTRSDCQEKIMEYALKKAGDTFTVRQLRYNSAAGRKFELDTISQGLDLLVKTGFLEEMKATANDKVVRYRLSSASPAVIATVTSITQSQ